MPPAFSASTDVGSLPHQWPQAPATGTAILPRPHRRKMQSIRCRIRSADHFNKKSLRNHHHPILHRQPPLYLSIRNLMRQQRQLKHHDNPARRFTSWPKSPPTRAQTLARHIRNQIISPISISTSRSSAVTFFAISCPSSNSCPRSCQPDFSPTPPSFAAKCRARSAILRSIPADTGILCHHQMIRPLPTEHCITRCFISIAGNTTSITANNGVAARLIHIKYRPTPSSSSWQITIPPNKPQKQRLKESPIHPAPPQRRTGQHQHSKSHPRRQVPYPYRPPLLRGETAITSSTSNAPIQRLLTPG